MENFIKIRPIKNCDIKELIPYLKEKRIKEFTNTTSNIEEMKKTIKTYKETGKGERRVITLGISKKIIGSIIIKNINKKDKKADIGYRIGKNFEGKGIMTKALYMILKYFFSKRKFERIEALIREDNIGSIKLVEKSGFVYEGTLRNYKKRNNKYYNFYIYSILKKDFENLTKMKEVLK